MRMTKSKNYIDPSVSVITSSLVSIEFLAIIHFSVKAAAIRMEFQIF